MIHAASYMISKQILLLYDVNIGSIYICMLCTVFTIGLQTTRGNHIHS